MNYVIILTFKQERMKINFVEIEQNFSDIQERDKDIIIATRGPSWNFSLAENLKSLSLQDGPREWHYFPDSYPPTHLPQRKRLIYLISQQPLVGSYSNLKLKLWDQIRVYKGIK